MFNWLLKMFRRNPSAESIEAERKESHRRKIRAQLEEINQRQASANAKRREAVSRTATLVDPWITSGGDESASYRTKDKAPTKSEGF